MPKISALPAITTIAPADELPIVDDSATSTKKITISQLLALLHPVGSVYTNASVSTNPSSLLGFGTWEAFGAGRVPVGKASTGTFATPGATGGAETHTLTTAEMPVHSHPIGAAGQQALTRSSSGTGDDDLQTPGNRSIASLTDTLNSGSGVPHNILQPYVVVYMWKRTA